MESPNFNKVKAYYEQKLWSKARVRNAVDKGWITEEEYETITGEKHDLPEGKNVTLEGHD